MKILHVINSLATGGAEKLLLDTLPLYQEKRVATDLLVLNGFEYPFLKELKELGCCKIFSLGNTSVYNPIHIFNLLPYLKEYDIVHVHLFPAQYWIILAKIISFTKVKLVFTEHNTSNRRLDNKFFSFIDRLIYKGYSKVICITQEIKEILLSHTGLSSSRFIVIKNGVNLSVIAESSSLLKHYIDKKINQSDTLLIQVAGFREQKDQPTLIKALKYLPLSVKLVLVGDGILRKECVILVNELQLGDRVLFLGLRMDVPQLLKTADIIVLSSKYEGLSLSSIEGMAAGKPFIASDVPGLSEVVQGAGILFPVGNSEQLAAEIAKLLENQEHYQSVAVACQQRAADYDIHKMVDKHITLYRSLAKT
ncbi:Glycosyltransferase involved in cell wall bisynthesis [Flavobacterium fryxellicola]|uniref:Glycosyl transferase n=1 Tax=Flavobacterium fryxellicola TaxID=249352 RepID=A0A167V182_9FLAO|nr:glycosyltransferase [Flavobacterium fryxellicola]OAB25985.1 glycosyl transferase [Flavobacterium fryxellicola]SHN69374.1 Glycosyltransferase involved in cell wall bisynthesis [Flavobacterium fryxellicola]